MNSNTKIPDLKGRDFNGRPYARTKRIRQEPRYKIRQLLRSFLPLNIPESVAQNGRKSLP